MVITNSGSSAEEPLDTPPTQEELDRVEAAKKALTERQAAERAASPHTEKTEYR